MDAGYIGKYGQEIVCRCHPQELDTNINKITVTNVGDST